MTAGLYSAACTETSGNPRDGYTHLYRDLRTNIPKEVMGFPDFPFDKSLPSFVHHTEVRKYLEKYCDHFRLSDHIKFSTTVDSVQPVTTPKGWQGLAWDVTTSNLTGQKQSVTERFDAVMVCNGHFYDPYIPPIPGLENFKGKLMHSHDYRSAEPLAGMSVVVLGAGLSGLDIAVELARVSSQVTLSHGQPPLRCILPEGVSQAPAVERVLEDGAVQYQGGEQARPEVFMLCTGYRFTFPFLGETELGLRVQDHLVTPLYKYLVPPAFPSLFIIGVCRAICPFPHFHCQTQFVLSLLDGSCPLPSREEMEREIEAETASRLGRGIATRHLLKLDSDQWDYNDELALLGRFQPLPPYWKDLYEANKGHRAEDLLNYKTYRYTVLNDREWTVQRPRAQNA
ncbi:uncharacterized protein LOC136768466 isoform X2 [Amia ocellicauda]|uniref:uncharacterized protein LOC136768466 isoform X2 n=1 Tax=Amia ocellicauda TaxID=2972642 RepID=UPI003463B210